MSELNPSSSSIQIRPAKNILGSIRLPGDKSISHRYAMLGAIAEGTTRLGNFTTGADCASTLSCLQQLGCAVRRDGANVEIDGREALQKPVASLDCGNSGSTMRMLSGILAGQDFHCELHGDESLSRRPMARVMKLLVELVVQFSGCAGEMTLVDFQGGLIH
jgi:3-phosphoshikimate 1-carboxyvinyltransferase